MHFCSRPIFMKNYIREFPKSLISNPLSDIQNSIWRKKNRKNFGFS